jgi:hypothetical protein
MRIAVTAVDPLSPKLEALLSRIIIAMLTKASLIAAQNSHMDAFLVSIKETQNIHII